MSESRAATVVALVSSYVRGDRTESELRDAALADPAIAPLVVGGLGCNGLAHDLLEGVGLSPFDADSPVAAATPSRDGLRRWLERIRDDDAEPDALCDWAADAFGWQDPDRPMDPVVQEILGGIAGSEDDVLALVRDEQRLDLALRHLERTPPECAWAVAVGWTVLDRRDELLVALVSRVERALDDDALAAALAGPLAAHRTDRAGLVEDLVEATRRLADRGADLDRVERYLVDLARCGDPIGALDPNGDDDLAPSG